MRETATLERLQEIADLLATEFNVSPPKVVFSRRRVACYHPFFRWIKFPMMGSWRGVEFTMVHEFAHHLFEMTLPPKIKMRSRHHGPQFRDLLHKVAAAWYGDPDRYNWGSEYKSIQEWYRKGKGAKHANTDRAPRSCTRARHRRAPGVGCSTHAAGPGRAGKTEATVS